MLWKTACPKITRRASAISGYLGSGVLSESGCRRLMVQLPEQIRTQRRAMHRKMRSQLDSLQQFGWRKAL